MERSNKPRLQPERALPLPRGPHRLTRELVAASQRGRILDALAEAVAEHGYASTTIADIVARAGVSRATFYEHFRDKEECFLAAYEVGVETILEHMATAAAQEETWREQLRAAVHTYLEILQAEPAFARTFLVEVFAAGRQAIDRRMAVHESFAQLFAEMLKAASKEAPDVWPLPDGLLTQLVGGVNELALAYVLDNRTVKLPDLEPVIMYTAMRLMSGKQDAITELERTVQSS